ncbi:hypothetical protein SeMB42_g05971 [Synchytrium endobioticum]|uniref:Kinetochore protein mis13 n=1 Tax=Synchytrium endobioticum TaxID=286115 RepID=A0A507CL98_9FUNG|nr:hypothetical protein SeMB42_g05971 [Synchytrium endobioticum]TPX47326.1 hypothetical protein SeLEV6574_g02744 [Synchytrium endobioticum]
MADDTVGRKRQIVEDEEGGEELGFVFRYKRPKASKNAGNHSNESIKTAPPEETSNVDQSSTKAAAAIADDRPIRPAPCEGAFAPEFLPQPAATMPSIPAPQPPAQEFKIPPRPNIMAGLFARRSIDTERMRNSKMTSFDSSRDGGGSGRRRSSLGFRGKRVSGSLNGLCPPPHESINPSEYYRHITADDSEPVRMRQLLLWCMHKAKQHMQPLSGPDVGAVFEAVIDDMIAGLTDKSINISWYRQHDVAAADAEPKLAKLPHPQNEENARILIEYQQAIEKYSAEEAHWMSLLKEQSRLHAASLDQYPDVSDPIPFDETRMMEGLNEDEQLFYRVYLQSLAEDNVSQRVKADLEQLKFNIHHLHHLVDQSSAEYTKIKKDCEALYAQVLQAYEEQEAQSRANVEPMEVLRLLAASSTTTTATGMLASPSSVAT